MMTVQERISQWVDAHEAELIRDIGRLVAVRSVRGEAEPDAPLPKLSNRAESSRRSSFPVMKISMPSQPEAAFPLRKPALSASLPKGAVRRNFSSR